MTDEQKPTISPQEMRRRCAHVRTAIANSRLAGMTIIRATQEIFDAYIRGEIEAADLVTAYLSRNP